ncbi:MAG: urea carboxylase-associated family protein [Thaumarchaeota archaeon]|nr:MAG: urea carboxylase-associated family protein [Nitrososphaerota archaeon]
MERKMPSATLNVVKEFTIPKCEGRSFTIKKGELLRIIEIEGPQAADMVAFNEHDFRESYSAWLTRQSSRSFTRPKKLRSMLPAGNVMFTVLTDVPGVYWLSAGRCNSFLYRDLYGIRGYHKNCHDILAESLKPFGISEWDVPDVFNVFMNAKLGSTGTYEFDKSPVSKGDYVDLRAEMDCLIATSACPDDIGAYNGGKPKPLKIQILK